MSDSVHGKRGWKPIGSVLRRKLTDDLLRACACAEMPDGLQAEVASEAYVCTVCASGGAHAMPEGTDIVIEQVVDSEIDFQSFVLEKPFPYEQVA